MSSYAQHCSAKISRLNTPIGGTSSSSHPHCSAFGSTTQVQKPLQSLHKPWQRSTCNLQSAIAVMALDVCAEQSVSTIVASDTVDRTAWS